ncbi:FAD-binding oxidoreductase [Nocardioides sp. T2.26MG-1]|uniref:FAD-binding oxidoreductase n=1 Tax=Nocardioides sp. T2.26MG-1 TaxID=3041166 RepID=UPI00254034D2|nr:FAD-binding oxidoreductase [Nocardioides sp. T2.26MG-1]
MLVTRDDPGFEEARVDRIFNRRLPGRQPAAVVRPETEAEVVAAVRLARERGWQVAVRSGGHSWAQWSVRDDALVIDLGGLHELEYDQETGIVRASPSTPGGAELAPYLAERGRMFVGGHCPTVGIGGFLLQGGQGWNARGWGWAVEHVVAVDVVTAAGELVRADATQHADLFWAARGAGPGFPGVVTRFHLRTRPLPRHFAHTVQAFDLADFDEVMTWLHDTHHTVADTVEIVALTKTDPRLAPGPVLLVTALTMVDDEQEADQALAPFRKNPALDRAILVLDNEPTTPEAERARQLEDNPEGHRWAVDNAWLSGPASEVVPAMRRAYTTLPNEKAFTIWFSMAPLRELPDMAFSVQSEVYLAAYVPWEDAAEDERHLTWLAGAMADLAPVTVGQYLGDSDLRRRPHRFLSEEAWGRLQQVYADRDPDRLFVGYLA